MEDKKSKTNWLKALGPGILFASTCVGVSHLVQSTKAGALYGLGLLGIVALANLLKYPFFEFGSRYASIKGETVIDGYKRLGKWPLYIYAVITVISMFLVSSAVLKVTSGFMNVLFGLENHFLNIAVLTVVCMAILLVGGYKVLDKLIKLIGIVLLLSTLICFFITIGEGVPKTVDLFPSDTFENPMFILALMGWMPTAVDLSSWNSIWTIERMKETGYKPSLKETLFDFNFGYITSAILALIFVTLGAYLMYVPGITPSNSASEFGTQVIDLYTSAAGQFSYIFIAAATFSIMFGTGIAVIDGYSRAANKIFELIQSKSITEEKQNQRFRYFVVIVSAGSLLLIYAFEGESFSTLVNLATVTSFIVAPFVAVMNTMLVGDKFLGNGATPQWLKILAYAGIVFLSGFSLYYIYTIITA